jgi:hypothetical protein
MESMFTPSQLLQDCAVLDEYDKGQERAGGGGFPVLTAHVKKYLLKSNT